ncbi:MAG: hypothetical protein COV55_04100 [Candidatus Komeilibacteria bacterium CG11_big_fil_rev_8_21_14_0_20_36_20]|uniref:Glycosyltransferase RgtA/B/C/D-like domain-containing protein n=1 Tax=Candidatus Komeilibacteria bacterium CG11_big_fil_rev_8_21_14_0_20_36_20 TaxID=1974477 RepID=A0A2H0NC24_9BACT|nr:MAG: hypothetical protein COV55_04100 [Candidatus Komeilibacteria bacterium CG11_big_fil_rev_8_21_14_0_20_36_20]PIR82014.1 MAG: hypothetical protein COU21_00735 [Candidatus Komeilibacteria bacterium CG10_big_fil_rev_8_21_14_0_10_36_65]PJC55552.1 MAG: hypothetical protein CO027_01740 [Candidatus Komeilibacteria bacterium CG_4_9_14_0_2_um_filter_36_13]
MSLSKEKKFNIILGILCLIFFGVYSFITLSIFWPHWSEFHHLIFNWPDANANYFFTQLLAQQHTFFAFEPLNQLTNNLLHARSVNVVDGHLVPITFLPVIVIFALFFKLLGSIGLLFLTPLLAALTVYIIYRLVYYIFQDLDLAFLVGLLMLPLAPWLYFANVVMLPTVLFIFLASLGWLLITKRLTTADRGKSWWFCLLGSLFLSLAIVVRPTEMIWLLLIAVFVFYVNRKKIEYQKTIAGFLVFMLILFLFLSLNKIVYGGYLSFGYLNLQSGDLPTEFSGSSSWLKTIFIPFGFHPRLIWYNLCKHFVSLIFFHIIFALGGILYLILKDKISKVWRYYFFVTSLVFVIILFFYGSWDLVDPLVKNYNTISISYVRYFMPLYLFILPLVALLIKAAGRWKGGYLIVAALAIFGFKTAFYTAHDGLLKTKETMESYYRQFEQVSQIAPQNAVIISERGDKIFFPYYKVVVWQPNLPIWPEIVKIIDDTPIFFYTSQSDEELVVEENKVGVVGLKLVEPVMIENNFRLFQVK